MDTDKLGRTFWRLCKDTILAAAACVCDSDASDAAKSTAERVLLVMLQQMTRVWWRRDQLGSFRFDRPHAVSNHHRAAPARSHVANRRPDCRSFRFRLRFGCERGRSSRDFNCQMRDGRSDDRARCRRRRRVAGPSTQRPVRSRPPPPSTAPAK